MSSAESPNHRLLLAKYFYTRGVSTLGQGGLFDAGLAVSLFQDAIEIALVACASQLGAHIGDKAPFQDIWRDVNTAAAARGLPSLELQVDVTALNKARVNFKHYGQRPDRHDADAHRVTTTRILEMIAKRYFDLEFSKLSLVSFVRVANEREALEAASKFIDDGNREEALGRCTDALKLMRERHDNYFQRGIPVTYHYPADPKATTYVDMWVTHLRSQIRDVEGLVFASLYGVAPLDFLFMRNFLPRREGESLKSDHWTAGLLTDESVVRCIELLAQYSIGMSDRHRALDDLLPGLEVVV